MEQYIKNFKIITTFAEKLVSEQKELDPFFSDFISEHFWELI